MDNWAYIAIDGGQINMNGTAEAPVSVVPNVAGDFWSQIRVDNSTSSWNYAVINSGNKQWGGRSAAGDGMVLANNSNFTWNHVTVDNAFTFGNTVQMFNSVFNIKNSYIGDSEPSDNILVPNTALKAGGGQLNLDNVTVGNAIYGIRGNVDYSPLPVVNIINMSSSSFINVERWWSPYGWGGLPAEPTSTPV
jgi:hypothetical protein